MDLRQQILDTPRALRDTLEKGRPEYEALVRRVRWGEGPIFIVGSGTSFFSALTGVHAFESLLGWPAIARSAPEFEVYSSAALRPRSVVFAVSKSGETRETLEAVRAARARGAVVLALTNNSSSALAATADLVFLVRAGDASSSDLSAVVCQQAALSLIGLVAALVLKRHHRQLDVLQEEFAKLPENVERIRTQLSDAVRALAAELRGSSSVGVVGGGFYHPAALHAAHVLGETAGVNARGINAAESAAYFIHSGQKGSAVLFVSGSACRLKKRVHAHAQQAKENGEKILAVTDGNDRELVNTAHLAVMLPAMTEMVGSILAQALFQSAACQLVHDAHPLPERRKDAVNKGSSGA
jgi:glucosamine--fructose-6-phosphate aminotransferase (isomerizing)